MIYTTAGVPLKEHLPMVAIQRGIPKPRRFYFDVDVNGNRLFIAVKTKLGDIMRVYRSRHVHRGKYTGAFLRQIRADKGCGRPV